MTLNNPITGPTVPPTVSPLTLLCITATTGIVDAVSILGLGHVFTANMTGNVVFLGFAFAGSPGFSVARSSMALLVFLLGAASGGRLAAGMVARPTQQWIATAFGIDGVMLLVSALTAAALLEPSAINSPPAYAVLGLTAFAMGIRNATVRKLGVADLTTTVLTLTITGLAADSSLAGGSNPRWLRRLASVSLMFAGAVAGSVMLRHSIALPLFICGTVSLACAFYVYVRASSQNGESTSGVRVHI